MDGGGQGKLVEVMKGSLELNYLYAGSLDQDVPLKVDLIFEEVEYNCGECWMEV